MIDGQDVTAPTNDIDTLSGLVDRVTFHNAQNGFTVLRVILRGRSQNATVVANLPTIRAGERITATGSWVNDRTHGLQFRAETLEIEAPDGRDGMEKYLASGMIKGVGPVYAKKLINAFGETVFDVIENRPEALHQVPGIGKKRAEQIAKSWTQQKAVRDIMVFLHDQGIGPARATRIYRAYGDDAVATVKDNPYRLARDIAGIGFRMADGIADRLGIGKSEMIRLQAGISFALQEAQGNGHCGLPREELLALAADLLDAGRDLIEEALLREFAEGTIVADFVGDEDCVFLTRLHTAEKRIANRIEAIKDGTPPWGEIEAAKAIPWVEKKIGFALADSQKQAIELALASKVLIITGGPGVGKTTLVNAILAILAAKKLQIELAAPTGRAAKRLSETTGREARTIHRLLEADPASGGFRRGPDDPIEADLVVIDEMSMVDVLLAEALFGAIPDQAAVLLVGDVDQLPSVGPGQVLADLIGSEALPTVRLTEIFRQAAESRIVQAAHAVNEGRMPDLETGDAAGDFFFIAADDPDRAADLVRKLVAERIPKGFGHDRLRGIQVLSPMNKGGLGTQSLNIDLQAALNPPAGPTIRRFDGVFGLGDKVMQTRNDYDRDVYNGDIGFITAIDPEEGDVEVTFDGRPVDYETTDLDALTLAYAITIHKSQGSEYPAVVIPLMTQHYTMLQRNLIYTAMTRGRDLVVLVGQKKALGIAVKNVSGRKRWSKLRERLAG